MAACCQFNQDCCRARQTKMWEHPLCPPTRYHFLPGVMHKFSSFGHTLQNGSSSLPGRTSITLSSKPYWPRATPKPLASCHSAASKMLCLVYKLLYRPENSSTSPVCSSLHCAISECFRCMFFYKATFTFKNSCLHTALGRL